MNKQPEALHLAAQLDPVHSVSTPLMDLHRNAAAELRRLHAENQALNNALQYSMRRHREMGELAVRQRVRLDELELQGNQRPLTNEQVKAGLIHLIECTDARERCSFSIGVRFAERAHGIK